jgi:hypothetical protein
MISNLDFRSIFTVSIDLNVFTFFQYDPTAEQDSEEQKAFENWLQCYNQNGMTNLVDSKGRTIWFQGPAGPMKPAGAKSRGAVGQKGQRTSKKKPDSSKIKIEKKSQPHPTAAAKKTTLSRSRRTKKEEPGNKK